MSSCQQLLLIQRELNTTVKIPYQQQLHQWKILFAVTGAIF